MSKSIFSLPELTDTVASFLTHHDLFACIQVNRAWHQSFLPTLWHTIDSRQSGWCKVLKACAHPTLKGKKDEAWVRDVFTKHAQFIRDLTICWPFLVTVLGDLPSCDGLTSLRFLLDGRETLLEEEAQNRIRAKAFAASAASRAGSRFQLQAAQLPSLPVEQSTGPPVIPYLVDQPPILLSPLFEGLFKSPLDFSQYYTMSDPRASVAEQERMWIYTQQFWLLITNNKATLKRLEMEEWNEAYKHTPYPFASPNTFHEIILPKLRQLEELTVKEGNPWLLLARAPWIKKLKMRQVELRLWDPFTGDAIISTPVCPSPALSASTLSALALTDLTLQTNLSSHVVIFILKNLPQLIRFACHSVSSDETQWGTLASTVAPPLKHGLETLFLHNPEPHRPKDTELASLLPFLPNLTSLATSEFGPESAQALVNHCPGFKHFFVPRTTRSIRSDALGEWEEGWAARQGMNKLLRECPTLKTVDASPYFVHAEDELFRMEDPWPCKQSLERFRIRIAGVEPMPGQEMGKPEGVSSDDESLLLLQKRSEEQHRRVYAKLATLTKLTHLDLGLLERKVSVQVTINTNIWPETRSEVPVFEPPQHHHLALSLESGLDALRTLTHLEMFGFEGMLAHKVREPELSWMSEHWPKLRIMHGLALNRGLDHGRGPLTEKEDTKAVLQKHLDTICPRVVHKDSRLDPGVESTQQYLEKCAFFDQWDPHSP